MMKPENEIGFCLIGGKHHADSITKFKTDSIIAEGL